MARPAPALASIRSGRRYLIPDPPPDGPPVECPSVTTILNNMAKPALVNAAAFEVAKFAYHHRDSWHELDERSALDVLKRAPSRVWGTKRDIGSAVHIAIDAHLKRWTHEEPPVVDDLDLLPYIAGAVRFLDDHVQRVIHSEVTVASLTYGFAGTIDLVAKLRDGSIAVCDWKSGKGVYAESALQLSAYANHEFAVNDDGTRHRIIPIDKGVVVHLTGDGSYVAYPVEFSPQLFRTFVALRTLQRFEDELKPSVLGEPLPFVGGSPDVEKVLTRPVLTDGGDGAESGSATTSEGG